MMTTVDRVSSSYEEGDDSGYYSETSGGTDLYRLELVFPALMYWMISNEVEKRVLESFEISTEVTVLNNGIDNPKKFIWIVPDMTCCPWMHAH